MLGHPCNQFGGQEPGDNSEILNTLKYVRPGGGYVPAFDLTQKADVNGVFADAVFSYARSVCPSPTYVLADGPPSWSPITTADLTWNFNAFVIDKTGAFRMRYDTAVDPMATQSFVASLLAE